MSRGDWRLFNDEESRLNVFLLRVDKVVAAQSYRQDFPFPGLFVENVRNLRQSLHSCTIDHALPKPGELEKWQKVEHECQAALRTVENYCPPGYQGNPLDTFKGAGMDFIVNVPALIDTIQAKVQAKLRADQANQEQPPMRSRTRHRS